MSFLTFEARAAPTRGMRINETDGQLTRKGQFLQNEMPLNSKHTILLYIIVKHKRNLYGALFKRITQLLVQIHKLQASWSSVTD